jgi:hypothetical protein
MIAPLVSESASRKAVTMLYGPSRLTAIVTSQSARVFGSRTVPRRMIPALLTRIEIAPISRLTAAASASHAARSLTSQR